MLRKRLSAFALAAIIAVPLALPVGAVDEAQAETSLGVIQLESVNVPMDNQSVTKLGGASVKDAVVINGVTNYLYPTFDDIDSALTTLETMIPEYYSLVTQQADLKAAYEQPYTEYDPSAFQVDVAKAVEEDMQLGQQAMTVQSQSESLAQNNQTATEELLMEQKNTFEGFLDIYENKAQNEEIKAYLAGTANPDPEVLAYLLPYNDPFVEAYFESVESNATVTAAAQTFNVTNGTAYAVKWATSYNTPTYSRQSSDCTNFASQILIAGGIKMHDAYPNENSGWWYRKVTVGTVNPTDSYYHSLSWIRADAFVRFMGTSGNTYPNDFFTFSKKVIAGDFIALDVDNDGDWNHVGYVTTKGELGRYGYKINNTTYYRQYYTFCVAQHSDNYYAWVHSSANNWETQDVNGNSANFAIVRRNATA